MCWASSFWGQPCCSQAWLKGSLLADGILQAPAVNLLCALMFAVLGIVALLRKATEREAEE